jgi:hypothetical protein
VVLVFVVLALVLVVPAVLVGVVATVRVLRSVSRLRWSAVTALAVFVSLVGVGGPDFVAYLYVFDGFGGSVGHEDVGAGGEAVLAALAVGDGADAGGDADAAPVGFGDVALVFDHLGGEVGDRSGDGAGDHASAEFEGEAAHGAQGFAGEGAAESAGDEAECAFARADAEALERVADAVDLSGRGVLDDVDQRGCADGDPNRQGAQTAASQLFERSGPSVASANSRRPSNAATPLRSNGRSSDVQTLDTSTTTSSRPPMPSPLFAGSSPSPGTSH